MSDVTPELIAAATGGKYRVERLIGQGGMGAVYLGVHLEIGSRVAIKVLPPEVRSHPNRLARFRREAAVAAQLSHPNIVPVFEFDSSEDLAFLVMPFIEGRTLEAHLTLRGPMTPVEVHQLLVDVGGALEYAHGHGVVHRDIKPANLIQEEATGRWMVTDFGVAHVSSPDRHTDLTATDATIGTVAYMAPEQLGGARDVDGRADLYSLAAVAFEALTGDWHTREGAAHAATALRSKRPDIPEQTVRDLTWPLGEARDTRPDSVAAWLGRLRPQPTRPRWHLPAAATLAVVLGALAVSTLLRGPPVTAPPVLAVLPFAGSTTQDSMLSQLLSWEIGKLDQYQIIEDTRVRNRLRGQFGNALPSTDSLVAFAATAWRATEVVAGTVTSRNDSLFLRIEVFDARRRTRIDVGEQSGPTAAIASIVGNVVVGAFAQRLAERWSGADRPTLPNSYPAVVAYFKGDRAFRRGDLDEARVRFDEVIQLDSSYAPAYVKRILATILRARPSEATANTRRAVLDALRYRDRLDPLTQRQLDTYRILVVEGDVRGTVEAARRIVDEYPEAIDVWFQLGALHTLLPSLTGSSAAEARPALNEVVARDPTYAGAYAMLIQVAIFTGQIDQARSPIARFLAIDSASTNARIVRLTDTLLFQPSRVPGVLRRLPNESAEVLENLAMAAVDARPPPGGRAIGIAAIEALRSSARNAAERQLAFRMRMSAYLGSGDIDRARRLLEVGPTLGVPEAEIDRWLVMGAATEAPALSDNPAAVAAAAGRLAAHRDDPMLNRWLADRWALLHTDGPHRSDIAALATDSVQGWSLTLDLDGLRRLVAGDTAGAIAHWESAISRYSLEQMLTGFAASLWATRADLVRVAHEAGLPETALTTSNTFLGRVGIMDQVVWRSVFDHRSRVALARGDTTTAIDALSVLVRNLEDLSPLRHAVETRLLDLQAGR